MPPEHPVKIYQEREGCTYKELKDILPRIEALKFKQIIVHKRVKILVEDTINICAEPSDAKFPTDEKTLISLRVPIHLSYVQCEYYPPENPAGDQGVLHFESIDGETIGYYHKAANSLSICDATHTGGTKGAESLAVFITVIEQFKALTSANFNEWLEGWVKDIKWPAILMGADPEFEITTSEGEAITACTVWPAGGTRSNKKFGHDGEAFIGEIRPNPKTCPLALTQEFKRLLAKVVKDPRFPSDGQMWVGGGMFYRIGGHIHVSGIDPEHDLLDHLGIYIAEPMRKSMNIDGGSGRVDDHHGHWTKEKGTERIRGSDDGDPNHWEWRPLMAYHFDEDTTNSIHCLFYCIIETYRRSKKVLKKVGITRADYGKLEFYDKYKEHIDRFVDKFVDGVQKMEGIDVLDRWFRDRPKEKRIAFVCLHRDPSGGHAGGTIYDGEIPKEVSDILDDLRGRDFPNLRKSLRCNVTHYEGAGIRYAGISPSGVKIVEKAIEEKMIGCDYSADILGDGFKGKSWDFCFQLPELSVQSETNRKAVSDMIYDAITVTLKKKKDVI